MCWLASRSLLRVLEIKSPGTVSGSPYTITAEEQPRSTLDAVLIPSGDDFSCSLYRSVGETMYYVSNYHVQLA